jgi:choline dehydrogenase-like flavoprotein
MDSHGKLWLWFHDTVSALGYSFCAPHLQEGAPNGENPVSSDQAAELGPPYNDVTRFIVEQQARMPDLLRGPLFAATLFFDLMGFPRFGRRFHTRAPTLRQEQLKGWKSARLGFCRDLARYFESLAVLDLYTRGERSKPDTVMESKAELPRCCEIAVVGSGPGGAVTACLLAEAGKDVVLLEEGPFLAPENCPPFSRQEMVAKYRHGGQTVALGTDKVAYVEGRCVGGGSEINSGLYHRTPPDILEVWKNQFRVDAIGLKELLPYFEACERELSVGLLPGLAPAASLKLAQGAQGLGWKCIETPRWYRYDQGGPGRGTRQTMTRTFIPRFLRAGGKLVAGAFVENVRNENGRWCLSVLNQTGGRQTIKAETVFLAAGAVQTPALLRRSGIKRNIGNAVQLHPTVKMTARFPEPVNSEQMGVPVHQVKEFSPALTLGCSISSPPYLALGLLDHPEMARQVPQQWRYLANYYAMVCGGGRGSIRVLPGFRAPLVRYRVSEVQRQHLAQGMRKLAEVLFAAGAAELYPGVGGMDSLKSKDLIARLPDVLPRSRSNLMTIHLFCSCPMGEDRSKCATDSFGRVHGMNNLYISDASLLCTSPGVNPQGTIMALARRNVVHFLE